jgi:formylglycine-generating enzyme required for sulfatase activity
MPGGCGNENTKPKDDVAPARVKDLRVIGVTDSTVTLIWTAPGDDGTVGQASRYDLRHSTSRLFDQDWDSGIPVDPPPVVEAAGTVQRFTVGGLPLDTLSFIALRTADDAGNWSVMSNLAEATPGPPLCVITPDSLGFGAVAVGTTFALSFAIRNGGGGVLQDQAGEGCPPEFRVVSGGEEFSLLAGEEHTVTVWFTPSSLGDDFCAVGLRGPCRAVPCGATGVEPSGALVRIDVGDSVTFRMGSPEGEPGRDPDETPHEVKLTRSLLVSDHEVTQGEWFGTMLWNESAFPGADRPVESVTWYDAVLYCIRRSNAEGLTPAYAMADSIRQGNHIIRAEVGEVPGANGYRLPTEAEWEYLCRAGTESAYYSGDLLQFDCAPIDPNLDPVAWYCGNSGPASARASQPVMRKTPNAWGLYDMHGNVYEWCGDWYARDYLPDRSDPEGPSTGVSKVARGGSYFSAPPACRSAFRLNRPPIATHVDVGLRVVRDASL